MAILKPDSVSSINGVKVNEYLLTKHNPNHIDMPNIAMNNVIGVTIHNTDWISVASGTTPAEQYTRATVNGNMNDVRVHYYVDNTCAWQNLPLNLSGWHAADGGGNGNRKTIAIECIMSGAYNENDKKSEDNAARLCAGLLKKYGLGINSLFTHTHWLNVKDGRSGSVDTLNVMSNSYKNCPAYILPHWNAFKNLVIKYLGDTSSATTSDIKVGDLVSIKEGATYYNGTSIPTWVTNQKWYVESVSNDRAVLGENESKNSNINSPVNVSNLIKPKAFEPYTKKITEGTKLYQEPGKEFCVSPTSVYTIIEEKTVDGVKYGKLKSGAGWIKL